MENNFDLGHNLDLLCDRSVDSHNTKTWVYQLNKRHHAWSSKKSIATGVTSTLNYTIHVVGLYTQFILLSVGRISLIAGDKCLIVLTRINRVVSVLHRGALNERILVIYLAPLYVYVQRRNDHMDNQFGINWYLQFIKPMMSLLVCALCYTDQVTMVCISNRKHLCFYLYFIPQILVRIVTQLIESK